MSADLLISRLQNVKKTGDAKWIARCPAHEDKTPSLSIRELPDERTLIHCFGGCDVESVLAAVDLSFADLFPPRPSADHRYSTVRRPWIPSDVFETARHEVMVIALIACDLHSQKKISEEDYQRLFVAVERLNNIAGAAYGSR